MLLEELSAALAAWADTVLPELAVAAGQIDRIDVALPMCEASVVTTELRDDPRYEQRVERVAEVVLLILAAPEDTQGAARTTERIVATLQAAARRDPSLGGRVQASAAGRATLAGPNGDPLRVQFSDGTNVRFAVLAMSVSWTA
jgi:alkylation response protein AidB-like acyl-CoA dehydrogenase